MSAPAGTDEKLHSKSPVARGAGKMIERFDLLRRLVKSGPAQELIYTARVAAEVEHPLRFVRDQATGSELVAVTDKVSRGQAVLRRRSGDLVMFHQVLGCDSYRPPPPVTAALGRRSDLRIADLGANVGLFTVSMMGHFPGSQIIAFEADPANALVFEETIAINGWRDRVDLRPVAAMVEDGHFELAGGDFFRSHLVEGDQGSSTSIAGVDVLPLLDDRDLIKIDIEGSEWPILADPRFAELPARALAMEWHRQGCPSPEPLAEVESALSKAGYEFEHDFIDDECGTLWAWKPAGTPAIS